MEDHDYDISLGKLDGLFYDPYTVGIKIEEIAHIKTNKRFALFNAQNKRRNFSMIYKQVLGAAREKAEISILEKRREEKEKGIRKEVGGQVTANQIEDYVFAHLLEEKVVLDNGRESTLGTIITTYDALKSEEDKLDMEHNDLVSRSIELNKIAEIAMSEWNDQQVSIREDKEEGWN